MSSTTSLIRQAGAHCDYEYARSIALLESWARGLNPAENARAAARTLAAKRNAQGGTHFVVTASGSIRSVSAEIAA